MKLRRIALCWLPVLVAAVMMSLVSAAPASAAASPAIACPMIHYFNPNGWPVDQCGKPIRPASLASTSHIGWVYLNLNYCAPKMMCTQMYRMSASAWSWSGTAWNKASINNGWVYVYPYTGEWRWAWTQESGWVAMNTGRFEIRSF